MKKDAPPRVFISYAQESNSLSEWVLQLSDRLRRDGVDCQVDQYTDFPAEGWRTWMNRQIIAADHVLVVCTLEYCRRFEGIENGTSARDIGRGVRWESQHITQQLYDAKFKNEAKIIPILPSGLDAHSIPFALKDYRAFAPDSDDGYEALLRLLTRQHETPIPPLGEIPELPIKNRAGAQRHKPSSITRGRSGAVVDNPYPGLEAFRPEQAEKFFGRDDDSERVAEHLLKFRLSALVGASGVGKSSLAAAGVIPRLCKQRPNLRYIRFTPSTDPVSQLAEAIHRALPEPRSSLGGPRQIRLKAQLRSDPADAIAGLLGEPGGYLLVLIDQFEELFTHADLDAASRFRGIIDALLPMQRVYILLTLRSEFIHRLMDWLGGERFLASLQPLDTITRRQHLRELIEQPARSANVSIQADLTEQLCTDLAQVKSLPLLALTLRSLFYRRDATDGMTLDIYWQMGGLAAAVAEAAKEIDSQIDASRALSNAAELLFAQLATVVDDVPTRRVANIAALRANKDISEVMDGLRGCGLLADLDGGNVELAHESLFRHWQRLQLWSQRFGSYLALRRQTELAANDWVRSNQNSALRWSWERQEPAILALYALGNQSYVTASSLCWDGIMAWKELEPSLFDPIKSFLHPEPLRLLGEISDMRASHQRREEIGSRLQQIGDTRSGIGLRPDGVPDIAWMSVDAGQVTLDGESGDQFDVDAFELGRYPITWKQYRAFLEGSDGFRNQQWWRGLACTPEQRTQPRNMKWGFDSYPAIEVSWYDAIAFCRWLTERLSSPIRLPSEWEWQWAATNAGSSDYPWTGEWDNSLSNSFESGIGRTMAVGLYPAGRSRWGIDDMSGNVWEWCSNQKEGSRSTDTAGDAARVLRGGAWNTYSGTLRVAYRIDARPEYRHHNIGFRVCRGRQSSR